MKKKNPSVYQPKPTIFQLMNWSTARLLRYYKSERAIIIRPVYYDDQLSSDREWQENYVAEIKAMLDTREHVGA